MPSNQHGGRRRGAGRPRGSASRFNNLANVAAHHLGVLEAVWLALHGRKYVPENKEPGLVQAAIDHAVKLERDKIAFGLEPGPPQNPPNIEQVIAAYYRRGKPWQIAVRKYGTPRNRAEAAWLEHSEWLRGAWRLGDET